MGRAENFKTTPAEISISQNLNRHWNLGKVSHLRRAQNISVWQVDANRKHLLFSSRILIMATNMLEMARSQMFGKYFHLLNPEICSLVYKAEKLIKTFISNFLSMFFLNSRVLMTDSHVIFNEWDSNNWCEDFFVEPIKFLGRNEYKEPVHIVCYEASKDSSSAYEFDLGSQICFYSAVHPTTCTS